MNQVTCCLFGDTESSLKLALCSSYEEAKLIGSF